MDNEKQRQNESKFLPIPPFSQGQVHSFIPDSPNSSSPRRMGKWGMKIYGQSIAGPLHSCFLLTLFTCSKCRFSTDSSFLQVACTCPGVGFSMGCSVDICCDVILHVLQGSLCPGPGAPPLPPSPLTWVLAEMFFTFLSSLSWVASCPILNTFSQRHQQLGSWLRCVLQWSEGPGWSCPRSHTPPQPLLAEANPAAPHCHHLAADTQFPGF